MLVFLRFCTLSLMMLLLLSGTTVHSQVIKGALTGGFNLTQVDGDEVYGYKRLGLTIGPAAIVPIDNRWSFSIETLFSQKGAYQRWAPAYNDTIPFYYKLHLNYLDIPLMIHFEDRETITVGAGFSYGRLVGAREWEYGVQTPTDTRGPYLGYDLNALVDLRFRLNGRLKFNFRYAYSMVPIRTRQYSNPGGQWTRKQYNNMLTFRLIYVFNEKQSEEVRNSR
jgi:hypothetical protein